MDETRDNPLEQFVWERQPEAERLVVELVEEFLKRCPEAAELARRMKEETGTRFRDWVDQISILPDDPRIDQLNGAGFVRVDEDVIPFYIQRQGVFPRIAIHPHFFGIDLKVDSVADFAAVHQIQHHIKGDPLSLFRWLGVAGGNDVRFRVVERHACRDQNINPRKVTLLQEPFLLRTIEEFRRRLRDVEEAQGFDYAEQLLDDAIAHFGPDLTTDLFFAAEREYWQRRNRAAQFQKARQDRLGLGWANHDHHTYRCSRKWFARLIGIWEKLGFVLRERFYAGAEAGWGAQVAEHPVCGIVTFNDVDLSPDELMNDFSHEPLPERDTLGTVGLWCGLHGESFLQAGMHHLECQFDFDSLKEQMERDAGIKVMKPFTDFPYLRQAFTEGERWPVKEERLQSLLARKLITPEQAKTFREQGAIGSHLENLERNEGFKGFNQKGVSEIISRVDPRKMV